MKIRYLFATLLLSVLPLTAANAFVAITIAPPPLEVYAQPECPQEGYLWTPGYWAYSYDTNDYYWVAGVWAPPPQIGFLWTPGYWGFGNGAYLFHDGYWGPTVGFYGGINYGYGYGGYGYYGGRWEGRTFRYNTAVTHVNASVIHNTYQDRSFHDMTSGRTSFNGRGGVTARPDAKQLAAAKGTHVGPTSAQRAAMTQAKTSHVTTTPRTAPNGTRTPNTAANRGPTTNTARTTRTTDLRHSNTSRTPVTHTRTTTRGAGTNRTRNVSRGPTRTPQVSRQTRAPQVSHQTRAPQVKQKQR